MDFAEFTKGTGKHGWRALREYWRWNPFRAPAWKWNLAGDLNYRRYRHVASKIDPWLRRVMDFQREPRRDDAPAGTSELSESLAIFEEDSAKKWELEARILARESNSEIAEKLRLDERVVDAFANVFFDVRRRLKSRDYISCTVIRTHLGFTPTDVSKIWSYFGYFAGSQVLDFIIDEYRETGQSDYSHLMRPTSHGQVPSNVRGRFYNSLKLMFLKITADNIVPLLHAHLSLMHADRQGLLPGDQGCLLPSLSGEVAAMHSGKRTIERRDSATGNVEEQVTVDIRAKDEAA